ncbi:MAG: terminase large subunit domain-containing protein [Candidatus Aenigmatarchaeota archaeon]
MQKKDDETEEILLDDGPDSIIVNTKYDEQVQKQAEKKRAKRIKRTQKVLKNYEKLLNPTEFAVNLLEFRPFDYQDDILHDGSPVVVVCCGRQVGKSTIAAVKGLHYAFTHEEVTVLIVAPTQRQSSNLFRKMKMFLNAYLMPSVTRSTRTEIEFSNGSRIISLPSGSEGDSIKGYTADLLIVDEAAFVPDPVFPAIMPMLATTKGQLILLSTPNGRRGFFYEQWKQARKDMDISTYHLPSATSPLISDDFLQSQRERMTKRKYRVEYMAEFISKTGTFFPEDVVDSCVYEFEELKKGDPSKVYYMGIDWGKQSDSTVIVVVERGEEFHKVVQTKEFKRKEYGMAIEYADMMQEKFNIMRCYADRGAGERQIEELKKKGINVRPIFFTTRNNVDLYSNLLFLMEEGFLKFNYNKKMMDQIKEFEYEINSAGNMIFKKNSSINDDYVDALALACFNLRRAYTPIAFKTMRKIV